MVFNKCQCVLYYCLHQLQDHRLNKYIFKGNMTHILQPYLTIDSKVRSKT